MNNQKYLRNGKWLTLEQLQEYNKNKKVKTNKTKK